MICERDSQRDDANHIGARSAQILDAYRGLAVMLTVSCTQEERNGQMRTRLLSQALSRSSKLAAC